MNVYVHGGNRKYLTCSWATWYI